MPDTIDYAALIYRHYTMRLKSRPASTVALVLGRCGLELTETGIRSRSGAPITEKTSFLYKQTLKDVLGAGVYEMTKINFMLAGCRCADCRKGV